MGENGSEVVRVDRSIVLIPLFGVDVPSSSQGIRLGAKPSRAETDDEVELGEKLQPASLPVSQEFRGGKVLEVLVVSDNANWNHRAFEIMVPGVEGFKDGQQFLVMDIVVEFRSSESVGVEHHWANLAIWAGNGENAGDSVVGGISLDDDQSTWNPMSEDRSGSEGTFELLERGTVVGENPRSVFLRESSQRDNNVRVVEDELAVEIGKAKERLDVLHLARFPPILNCLDHGIRHSETTRRKQETEVFNRIHVEFTFFGLHKKAVFLEPREDFFDMPLMGGLILEIDEDVIQIDNNTDVKHICEDIVDKLLEGCGGVGQAHRHD